ncbi:SIR2 family protein [Hyalangium versicolor]|uniref:SIR2 family protein n=1 Tax=Hyalangium versicolor TaxID=2861190 RepID=UPI001CCF38E6|nr:SIR2 family protein [Hyalangium versicolor]
MKQEVAVNLREAFSSIHADDPARSRSIYFAFENFVLELLRTHAESQRRSFRSKVRLGSPEGALELDAVAPEGLDGIPGPAAFEIKLTKDPSALHAARKAIEHVALLRHTVRLASAVIILNRNLSPEELGRLQSENLAPGLQIQVWGPKELQLIAEQHPETARLLIENLPNADTAKAIQRAATGQDDDWRRQTQILLGDLHHAWRNNDLVPFLGAGVSIDAGIPSWNGLLNQLLVAMVEKMGDDGNLALGVSTEKRQTIAQRLQRLQESSPLLAARYIRSGLGEWFVTALERALYSNLKSEAPPQLAALARLCVPRKNGSGVQAVVTYNFDDLVEKQLREKAVEHQPVYLAGTRVPADCLAIYHVHGFLPQHRPEGEDSASSLVVFSEERYHGLYNDPYSWSNIVQLNLLSDHTGVFIGLSMNDPNLRRLLEIAAKNEEKPRHVALLKRLTIEKFMADEPETQRPDSSQLDSNLAHIVLAAHHQLIEKSVEELGVRVAWFEDFGEIAMMIDQIRQGAD